MMKNTNTITMKNTTIKNHDAARDAGQDEIAMTTQSKVQNLIALNNGNFGEFTAKLLFRNEVLWGNRVLKRGQVYLTGAKRDAFRLVSCTQFLKIAAGKAAWF